ncbi:MAG: hypothetical protein IGS48_01485 [Oscillatoriales cyanobacterium C42_A2020_001]|nr:hypothetical protein [Leptolyngbyaceae cyanobacterium C42_A2020_001]
MQRTMFIVIGAAFALIGFIQAGFAQTGQQSPSPAQMLGVQERSIQQPAKPTRRVVAPEPGQTPDTAGNDQLLLYRIDRNTRVVVGPGRSTAQPGDFPSTAPDRDNRLQLLLDLDQ